MAGRKPGTPKTGGRQKGTPNKLTADVKAMVLSALDKAGGVDYLLNQATTNPTAFMTLVGKVLPLTLEGGDKPIQVARIELVAGGNGAD
jgi:hypothetical protein